MRKFVLCSLVIVSGLISFPSRGSCDESKAGGGLKKPAAGRSEIKDDIRDLREDRRELRKDLRNNADPKELQQDRNNLKNDRRELFSDLKKLRKNKNQQGTRNFKRKNFGMMAGRGGVKNQAFGNKLRK